MLDIFSTFATDETLENEGTWFPLGGDARVLVARFGNTEYNKAFTKAYEQNRVALELGGEEADAVSVKMMIDVMAETILLGWEGLGFKKQPMDYSVENATKLLAVKDFRQKINEFSRTVEAYKLKEEVEQGKA